MEEFLDWPVPPLSLPGRRISLHDVCGDARIRDPELPYETLYGPSA